MEIGRIAEIENSKVNNSEKTQKVINVDEKNKVIQEDQYKKALGSGDITDKNEIILDNVKFGYDKSSKNFFVKITRGDAEFKYPTEDMMKVKAYMLQELESRNK
ncbi:MAG: flagellin [Aliarcobacter sp.]|jgi:uncharacterized FlaG/YvyC family protein|nr:flagellin [Aliarcobacter sp.]MDD4329544.1 flagellin [Aliarcobacter sp.]